MMLGVKLYWWCIALGFGMTVMLLLEHNALSTLIIGNAIAIMVFVAEPENTINGSAS